jgi:hypothetical protein
MEVHTSSRVFSAIILWNPIPTPSITASKHAHPIAEFLAALYPPLIANAPPVKNPAITVKLSAPAIPWQTNICHWRHILALYGSSFFLTPLTAQSNVEKSPPQTPKLPPNTGARALIAVRAPIRRSPYGEFRKPFTPCHTAPPIACKSTSAWDGQRGCNLKAEAPIPESPDMKRRGAGEMESNIRPYRKLLQNRSMPPRGKGLACDPSSRMCPY